MSDNTVLAQLINHHAKIEPEPHYARKKVVLNESQAQDSKIEILNVPDDVLVIDLDRVFSNSNLFQGSKGECKRADYLMFSEERKKVLYIEMKQGSAKLNDIICQLKGALCAVEYTRSIAREFYDKADFLQGFEQRFISIKHTGSRSRKTEITKPDGTHNVPDKPLIISWAKTVQYQQIAA